MQAKGSFAQGNVFFEANAEVEIGFENGGELGMVGA